MDKSILDSIANINIFNLNNSKYPGATLFVKGCNMSCWFCHNREILKPDYPTLEKEDVLSKINKMKKYKDFFGCFSVTVCGGEPTIYPDLKQFLSFLKQKGFFVKLDTNGYLVSKIKEVLDIVDLIAVDIKYPPDKYLPSLGIDGSFLFKIFELSIVYKSKFVFRTTVLPDFLVKDIEEIKSIVNIYGLDHTFQKYVS